VLAQMTRKFVRRFGPLVASMLVAMALGACGAHSEYAISQDGQVYTLVNLHAPARGGRLSSVNYQGPVLVPVCTPVSFSRITDRAALFTAQTSGQAFQYVFHRRSLREPIEQHLARYFGTACPDLTQLSAEDQAGVRDGRVYQGMTRQGVLLAIGYPPQHATPSLDADSWRYWRARNGTFEVYFQNGVVAGIRE